MGVRRRSGHAAEEEVISISVAPLMANRRLSRLRTAFLGVAARQLSILLDI